MEILNLKTRDAVNTLVDSVKNNKEVMIFCHTDEKVIGHGVYEDLFDKDYCVENNIILLNANFPAGACVVFEGDINLIGYEYGFSDIGKRYIECVNNFLHTKGINSQIVGNDLIIEENGIENKVGSYASVWVNEDAGVETVAHISMNVDLPLIERICKKPMVKIPKALSDYGITEEEVIEYLNENMPELKNKLL